ncbi:hypothetical protein GCM10022261_21320 [Brevibacterium daeguense]|uniref:DUF4247 domain-containing protein n=1 Tax=Brevibacterium daeguense TaxID=909936 RepID=A0ABP8EKT4_9MICO|nr:hypothetical protein [Brevibacterium daeguense]
MSSPFDSDGQRAGGSREPRDPRVSMSGGSFDFDRAQNSDDEHERPGSHQFSNPQNFGGNEGGKRAGKGCGCIVGLLILVFVLLTLIGSCSNRSGSYNCGDYDLRDGQYVSNPDRGDYVKEGADYRYVGCDTSNRSGGGGIWFLPFFTGGGSDSGSNYGGGSGYRGGGSGSGK